MGNVVDLLEVDLENAALLEVALGARAQLIVLEDGRPLLDYLADDKCRLSGRVGFLAIGSDQPATAVASQWPVPSHGAKIDLTGHDGVVCRADRLVRSASGIHHLPERLLADTWIVASLETAWQLSAQTGDACRFVTLQGELLESNGTLYVGSVRSEAAARFGGRAELRGIKNELARLDKQVTDAESAVERAAIESTKSWSQEDSQLQFDLDLACSFAGRIANRPGGQRARSRTRAAPTGRCPGRARPGRDSARRAAT